MKRIEKKNTSSKIVLISTLSAVLLLLIVCFPIIKTLKKGNADETAVSNPAVVDKELGEDVYLNSPIAYPRVEEAKIQYILVQNKNGTFDLTRNDKDGTFWLSYDAGDGIVNAVQYLPPIVFEEGDFDYQTLYALETGDGFGSIYMLTYLSVALGTPYFNERIELPEDQTERNRLLAEYGFGEKETVSFAYSTGEKDADGKDITKTHSITVGGQSVSGSGYYFMVDGRNYVYYTNSEYYEYALRGFHTFVKGMLVSAGIASDSAYEPYLTTDFKEWANEKHEKEGEQIAADSIAVIEGVSVIPIKKPADYISSSGDKDGYVYEAGEELAFDLEVLKDHHDYGRISSIITSLSVGELDKPKTVTLTLADGEGENMLIDFTEAQSYNYSYTIYTVESILTDTDEITEKGTPVGENNLIKVSYSYSIDGKVATSLARHAVLDISSPLISDEVEEALRACAVGDLDSAISLKITYNKTDSYVVNSSFVLTGITKIFGSDGKKANKVTADSYVTVCGYELVNGKKSELKYYNINLSNPNTVKGGEEIKAAIVGKARTSSLSIPVAESETYYEVMRDFTAYELYNVKYFVTSELITSFRFVNASKRDPYYGESFYENTFPDENPYHFYGLNASACEKVVAYLGGIGGSGSVTSAGLSGETVAIGLNHATLDKYGLYAYKIYFELPRYIEDVTEGTEFDTEDTLSDYEWYSELGFTLYISERNYDEEGQPFRYVGSDMYDLVAKVYGEELDFVEYGFTEFWARRNFLLTSIERVENIEVDFNFEDLDATYNFELTHKAVYVATVGNKMVADYEPFDGATKADQLSVYVSAVGDNRPETEFDRIFENNKVSLPNAKDVSISQIYAEVQNGGEPMWEDIINTVGVSNFKSVFELTQLVRFHGILTDEERALAEDIAPVMTIKVKMDSNGNYYTYEFIRFDDRKVMVRLYEADADGNMASSAVSDFYITTFALKKLVGNYMNLLNGVSIDRDQGYLQ